MFDTTPFIGKAYYGRKAGKEVMDRLNSARHTIKIVSPYLSQKLISVLLDKAAQGVDVTLVTSTEIENSGLNIYQNFIRQTRITDEPALQRFRRFSAFYKAAIIVFIVALLARFGLKLNLPGANYVLLALFGGLLFAGNYRKRIRTYSYNYNTTIRFKSIASPNTDKNLFGDPRCALIHTKLFIVDGTLFTGSVNFTQSAFWYNHESLLSSNDPAALRAGNDMIESFFASDYFYARTPEGIGRRLYREHLNPIS